MIKKIKKDKEGTIRYYRDKLLQRIRDNNEIAE